MQGTKTRPQTVTTRHVGMLIAAVAVLCVAADLRICGAQNGLWLDEIWSVNLLDRISTPIDVFFKIHHDNNHYLNTLFIYLLGRHGDWPGYRALSVVAGIGAVVLAGLIGRERDGVSGLMAMSLTGFSYVLILYSSEARGYSLLVFFSFLSYYLMGRYLKERRWPVAVWFSLAASLGFLSQLIFASFFLSIFLWTTYRLIKDSVRLREIVYSLILCYGLPAAVIVTLYLTDIRYIGTAGGTKMGLWQCYASAEAWVSGMPPMTVAGFLVIVIILGLTVWMLWREEADSMVFFAGTIGVVPLIVACWSQFEYWYVRHFIVQIAFSIILLSYFLATLYGRPGYWGKAIALLLLGGYMAANGWHVTEFLRYGRGDDRGALRYMIENTNSPVMTVGGDIDFRIETVLGFYGSNGMVERRVEYREHGSWPAEGVEWFVSDKESFEAPVSPDELTVSGHLYRLTRVFPTTPLSGLHWFVYHRAG